MIIDKKELPYNAEEFRKARGNAIQVANKLKNPYKRGSGSNGRLYKDVNEAIAESEKMLNYFKIDDVKQASYFRGQLSIFYAYKMNALRSINI